MPRRVIKEKSCFFVGCEGSTEQAYINFLKNQFCDVAAFLYPKKSGTTQVFEDTASRFENDATLKEYTEQINEIWLFFDVEDQDYKKWNTRWETISKLQKVRRGRKKLPVRLLMTSGCLEYWFLLHYEDVIPPVHSTREKNAVQERLQKHVPDYKKGRKESITQIAQNYQVAIPRGEGTIKALQVRGIPALENTDARNRWLLQHSTEITFTTVHEAIQLLEGLRARQ